MPLRGAVRKGMLVISGFARDLAGNTTALPQCVVDPVTGQGRCTVTVTPPSRSATDP